MRSLLLLSFTLLLASCSRAPGEALVPIDCSKWPTERVVVLGSSSAAGAGAEGYQYSWAGKLAEHASVGEMTNIARGGLVSFQLLPVNAEIPEHWSQFAPIADVNVDMALSLNPSMVVISLPSNDQAVGFSLDEVKRNFLALYNEFADAGVPVLFVGMQPRTKELATRLKQDEHELSSVFGQCWVSVFETLSESDGTLHSMYDYDGVHLNRAGHSVVLTAIVDALF